MTTNIQELIDECADSLADSENARWPYTELRKYLSDAQRAAVLLKPEVNPKVVDHQLVSSSLQTLPIEAYILIDVTQNVDVDGDVRTPGMAITPTDRSALDQAKPLWHRLVTVATSEPENYVYDIRNRKSFYLYPVHTFTARDHVELIYAKIPDELTAEATVTELDAVYRPALLAYMLHRSLAKRFDTGVDFEHSAAYFQQFRLLITGESDENESELTIRHQVGEGEKGRK